MSEHTKGEWYVSEHEDNNDTVVRGELLQIVANCTVDFYGGHPQSKEIQTNARLIAAAPDLLAACEAQEEADNWFGSSSTGRKLKNKAKELRQEAITKAKP